ncbi:MAG: LuxR family transcriptional regulator [Chitinophagaceae bacterium]|nr:LuxR family transcriptional regulator [Chitinophagaceae bacterium]
MATLYKKKETSGAGIFNQTELQIIRFVCKGYTDGEIGDKLEYSKRSIEGYRRKMYKKMKVRNTAGFVVYAIQNGFFKI